MPDVTEDLEQDSPQGETADEDNQTYETTDGEPYADDFSNLSAARLGELRDVCNAMDKRDEWACMIEIIRATLRRYFLIGQQHPEWNADAGTFQVGPSGATLGEEDENAEEFFEEEFNLFRGYHDVFNAVFSQTAAPSRMEPDKPQNGNSVKAAREAGKYLDVYQKFNPPKVAQSEVATLMWTDGRIVAVTDYEEDEEKCGVDENGEPLGAEITHYYGVLETKCPIVEPFRKWPYLKVEHEIDVVTAKHENPKIATEIENSEKSDLPNNEIRRMSRIAVAEGVAQISSDTLAYLVTESRWWLRPQAFRHLAADKQKFWIGGEEKDENGNKRKIKGIFEKGCRVKYIGSKFAGAKPIAMDAQVKVMHTNPGTGNSRGSKSDAIVPIQMEFNDAMGMYSEMIHKCIPHTLINTQEQSLAAITEQFSRFGEWAALQIDNGMPLAENIFQEQTVDVPASFPAWIANLQATLPQQLANIQPAMFGGNMEDQKTAKAYQQAKDMSMGVMAIVWVPYLTFAAGIRWQAARLAAKREKQKTIDVALPQKGGRTKTISVDLSVLGAGGYLSTPVTDQNFPESHTDKQNRWFGLFQSAESNPAGISAQILTEPDNRIGLKDAIGLDLVMPGEQARDRQLTEWELMKDEDGPVPDLEGAEAKTQAKQQAAQQAIDAVNPGAPAPPVPQEPPEPKSSVPIRIGDDDIEHARTCRRILESQEVWDMLTETPAVVEDLVLHMTAHLKRAQASGIQIPPDLLGIIPPLPPAPGLPPASPAAPAAAAHPHKGGAPAAGAPPAAAAAAAALGQPTLGGNNAIPA